MSMWDKIVSFKFTCLISFLLSFSKNFCFFWAQHSNEDWRKLFISIRFVESPRDSINVTKPVANKSICVFKPAHFFYVRKTWILLTFFHKLAVFVWVPPLCCLFITPGFACSTCRTSWVKFEQGSFIPIFFELGALSCSPCVSFTFFPFISFLFHIFCTLLFPSLPPFAWSSFLHPVKHRGSGPKIPNCGRCLPACWKCSITTPTQRA